MSCAENVYTCPVKFASHCLSFLTQGSRILVTCSMSNDHKDYCTYMNTEPVFPLGSKVWGVGRTCDFCGDSRLLRAGAGSIEENNTSWVDIWEDDGRWDQVDPSGTEISTFLGDLEEAEKGWCVWYCLVIMRSGSICLIESFNLSPRRRRCSPFLVKYRLAATIRRDPSLPQICTPPVNHPVKVGATRGIPLRLFHEGRTLADPKPFWNCRKRHVLQW